MEPIIVTENAARAIREKTALREGALGLKLGIKSTGCSGNSYMLEHAMTEDLAADDKIEKDGAVLYIPKTASWMLFGMEIGYEENKLKSGFTFTNPNETGRCGCGESFSVERPDK